VLLSVVSPCFRRGKSIRWVVEHDRFFERHLLDNERISWSARKIRLSLARLSRGGLRFTLLT
jgi:hypothetical protein